MAVTPFCSGNVPLDGTAGKTGAVGPVPRLKTLSKLFAGSRSWIARTGRFCVTVWPNVEPKTPYIVFVPKAPG